MSECLGLLSPDPEVLPQALAELMRNVSASQILTRSWLNLPKNVIITCGCHNRRNVLPVGVSSLAKVESIVEPRQVQ